MNEYLKQNHGTFDFDVDFKQACVWVGDVGELVTWSVDDEGFMWHEDVITQAGISVEKDKAEEYTNKQ